MRCLKPITLLNAVRRVRLFAGALLATAVTRSVVDRGAQPKRRAGDRQTGGASHPAPTAKPATAVRQRHRRRRRRRRRPDTSAPRCARPATPATTRRSTRRSTARPSTRARRRPRWDARRCHGPGEAHASDPEKVKPMQFEQDFGQGSQRHLHDLPQQGRARAVERQPARSAQRLVHQLPQHPQARCRRRRS